MAPQNGDEHLQRLPCDLWCPMQSLNRGGDLFIRLSTIEMYDRSLHNNRSVAVRGICPTRTQSSRDADLTRTI